jgi:hypothetical protein
MNDDSLGTFLQDLLDFYEQEPWVLLLTTLMTAVVAGGFLVVVVRAITKAGTLQPPRTVLSLLVALVALIAILGVIIRPEVDSLAVAAGTAIGGLAGALATAFTPSGIRTAATPEPDHGEDPDDADA